MTELIFKKFIKDYENPSDPKVRDAYGKVAGVVGIISNMLLSAMKVFIGLISGSIAIVADGFNNLGDAASSIITLIGFKLSALPEDEEHPYGHARIEYLAGLAVSVMILVVGVELGKSSIEKILNPSEVEAGAAVIATLVIAIFIKLWQASFNVKAGKKINSVALIATGADSRNDVISTSVVLVSIIAGRFLPFAIDGYMGVLVALFILYSGFGLVKETISPLLGEAPDPEMVNILHDSVMAYEGVLGIHDLIVHNYGPGKVFATVHIEVSSKTDIMESHDLMDRIEYEVGEKMGILITAHMDPIDMDNPDREPIMKIIQSEIDSMDGVISFHDLRFVAGPTHTNIIFDVVVSPECKLDRDDIHDTFAAKIREYNEKFLVVNNFDLAYAKYEK